jgi:hypothetical protein
MESKEMFPMEDDSVPIPTDDIESIDDIRPGIVQDDSRADYYLEILISKQAEVNRLNDRLEALNHRIASIKNGMSYYKTQLTAYMEGLNKANPKHKTHPLTFGELAARKLPDKVEIARDLTDADYDEETPFVSMQVAYKANKNAIKGSFEEGQPIPDWATVVKGETKYTVKIVDDFGRETAIE